MILVWRIRYLDRDEKQFKDRDLFLDTESLDGPTKAAVEFVMESRTHKTEREILKYRELFHADTLESKQRWLSGKTAGQVFYVAEYFEDESGNEITRNEMRRVLTGNPNAMHIPSGADRHDIDFMLAEPKPIPVDGIALTQEDLKLFGHFSRDLQKLEQSAFQEDGPGWITFCEGEDPILETAVTDDEIRSFVTIFRCLYMSKEPANFVKAVAVYTAALGDHRYGRWVAGKGNAYEESLKRTPELRPFLQKEQCTFTRKRLIDVFLYTQFAHQPSEQRHRQYNKCLQEVQGKKALLTWAFLTELHRASWQMIAAGRHIVALFDHYCERHQVSADVLASVAEENPGIGSREKEDARSERLLREKAEELAMGLWQQNGRPEGGPMQFLHAAQEQLRNRLREGEGPTTE